MPRAPPGRRPGPEQPERQPAQQPAPQRPLPPLAPPVAFFAVFWGLWAFANFVTELHGFNNPMMVLGGVVLTTIVLFIGVAMLLAILGITPSGGT